VASRATHNPSDSRYEKLAIFALAAVVLVGAVGSAFAAGFVIGRILL
jgi:preprotein translocase subunit Sss1